MITLSSMEEHDNTESDGRTEVSDAGEVTTKVYLRLGNK